MYPQRRVMSFKMQLGRCSVIIRFPLRSVKDTSKRHLTVDARFSGQVRVPIDKRSFDGIPISIHATEGLCGGFDSRANLLRKTVSLPRDLKQVTYLLSSGIFWKGNWMACANYRRHTLWINCKESSFRHHL
uniref:Protein KTI12 n=1 Tax=Schistocephalus solidus TaxID=70667 RepID=A0A0X3PJP6_SCHSO